MPISKQHLINWVNAIPDGTSIGIDDGGLTLQVVGDQNTFIIVGGLPEDGYQNKKLVAICGICGENDKEGSGEGGSCKLCGGDHWVELSDFNVDSDFGKMINHITTAASNLHMSVDNLHVKLLKLNNN
jgi:hypothetical protein